MYKVINRLFYFIFMGGCSNRKDLIINPSITAPSVVYKKIKKT